MRASEGFRGLRGLLEALMGFCKASEDFERKQFKGLRGLLEALLGFCKASEDYEENF